MLTLTVCGGGSGSYENKLQGVSPETPEIPVTQVTPVTPIDTTDLNIVNNQGDAAKFLNRATFGPTEDSINELVDLGDYEKWIDNQFNTQASYHFADVKRIGELGCDNIVGQGFDGPYVTDHQNFGDPRVYVWWDRALNGKDQLRQRVAFALSEIIVVSGLAGLGLNGEQLALSGFYDVLLKHSFGNYRELLEEVTLHPVMGDFLSMTRNEKANGAIRPDENYARELLQLFTIGVHMLNVNGTKITNENGFIPTYNQQKIEEFSKVFTGWSYENIDWNTNENSADCFVPLKAFPEFHDTSAKNLLNGEMSPAGQTPLQDVRFALDNIFNHTNVGPYISKQLIQRLVTSNPTPPYVARVAQIFNDNGNGVKGDMKAVIKAILLDEEALAEKKSENFGKLREPLLRMSHLWRAFNFQASLKEGNCKNGGLHPVFRTLPSPQDMFSILAQGPLQAPSVFNFFSPDYAPVGILNPSDTSDAKLLAPEFQTINENTLVSTTNLFTHLIDTKSVDEEFVPALGKLSVFDFRNVTTLANNVDDLLDHLDMVLMNSEISNALRDTLKRHLNDNSSFDADRKGQLQKAKDAILLIITSSEYLIQK